VRVSATVSCEKKVSVCERKATSAVWRRWHGETPVVTVPVVAIELGARLARDRRNVDLPAPLGPRMPRVSPAGRV